MTLSQQLLNQLSSTKKNLNQKQIAEALDYSPSHYNQILHGAKNLTIEGTLRALQLISGQTNVTMFLSRRKTGSVEDNIQRSINQIQDLNDEDLQDDEPDEDDVIETKVDQPEEGLPDDEENYQGQEIRRRKLGEKLSSRRVRVK